ncbi:hypothetical protein, partial [Bradyrhizobium liaoningense]|uniref:hypothetical protein n=1 Tax=Bradyrhizobium liaoningense TaxID=43992 RepID=UPI0024E04B53
LMSVLMHGTSVPRVVKSTRESRSSRPPKRGGVVVPLSIDLMSDHLEDHLPPVPVGSISVEWSNVIYDPEGPATIALRYGKPVHLNWSSVENEPQPIKAVALDFNPQTSAGSFTPIFR